MQVARPLLFLDVDGVLLPFGGEVATDDFTEQFSVFERLVPAVAHTVAEMPCDIVWATTWGHMANEDISPRLGWPALPVVT